MGTSGACTAALHLLQPLMIFECGSCPVGWISDFACKGGAHLLCLPLQVNHWSDNLGKWEGFAIWDTATHSQPLADRPAQQIKADLTLKFKMRVSSSCYAVPPCVLHHPPVTQLTPAVSPQALCCYY